MVSRRCGTKIVRMHGIFRLGLLFLVMVSWGVSPVEAQQQAAQPPSAHEAAPPGKKANLTYADRKAWYQILKWPKEYEDDFDAGLGADKEKGWLKFYHLSPRQYLVEVQCQMFAYQAGFVYLFYDEAATPPSSRVLNFETISGEKGKQVQGQETLLVGFPEFDPARRELSVWQKGRGLGDCGTWALHRLEDGRAALKEFRAKENCDGKYVDPKKYPRIFPK